MGREPANGALSGARQSKIARSQAKCEPSSPCRGAKPDHGCSGGADRSVGGCYNARDIRRCDENQANRFRRGRMLSCSVSGWASSCARRSARAVRAARHSMSAGRGACRRRSSIGECVVVAEHPWACAALAGERFGDPRCVDAARFRRGAAHTGWRQGSRRVPGARAAFSPRA